MPLSRSNGLRTLPHPASINGSDDLSSADGARSYFLLALPERSARPNELNRFSYGRPFPVGLMSADFLSKTETGIFRRAALHAKRPSKTPKCKAQQSLRLP